MDNIKTGQFIKECRKEKKLTQQQVAESLGISFKTVSKWECGNGAPDVSLMLPLCELLEINVNELLTGSHISNEDYKMNAEKNLMNVLEEKKENKKKIIAMLVVGLILILGVVPLVLLAGLLTIPTGIRILLIALAVVILVLGIGVCCVLDQGTGYYVCPNCQEHFIPSMKSFVSGPHTFTKRKLVCPKCHETHYCKKTLTK